MNRREFLKKGLMLVLSPLLNFSIPFFDITENSQSHAWMITYLRFQWVCDYFGRCGWLDTWDPNQVYFYWQNLVAQYNWLTQYHYQRIIALMQNYYLNNYIISYPFVVPYARSLYFVCRKPSVWNIIAGLNSRLENIEINYQCTILMNSIISLINYYWKEPVEAELCSAPQSSSFYTKMEIPGTSQEIEGYTYKTFRGKAFISGKTYKNVKTNKKGYLVFFDSLRGEQMSLVEA